METSQMEIKKIGIKIYSGNVNYLSASSRRSKR